MSFYREVCPIIIKIIIVFINVSQVGEVTPEASWNDTLPIENFHPMGNEYLKSWLIDGWEACTSRYKVMR